MKTLIDDDLISVISNDGFESLNDNDVDINKKEIKDIIDEEKLMIYMYIKMYILILMN